MFLKNCWYVAAQASELGRELTQRWITNEPVVLFRDLAGRPVAARGPLPASPRLAVQGPAGRRHGAVRLPRHAVRLCRSLRREIPGQQQIPAALKARSYPVVQKWQGVWIWMGDAALAENR